MADQKRQYRMKRRAELEAQTRQRITESAMELHGTLGPARTSVSAVADGAGVRRSTVYRHFPDERALFAACSSHWAAENPPPDINAWASVEDPDERLRVALGELYAYYGQTEEMLDNLLRDQDAVPVVKELLGDFRGYLTAARDVLAAGRGLRGHARRRVLAALGHALAFPTWRSLVREHGLAEAEAVDLIRAAVAAAAAPLATAGSRA